MNDCGWLRYIVRRGGLIVSFIILGMLFFTTPVSADDSSDAYLADTDIGSGQTPTTRPSANGRLHVEGKTLKDEQGNTAVLRGVSTHGLTWYPEFVNESLFKQLSGEWDSNVIRLAAYSGEYVNGHREDTLELVRKGIDAAIAADMYVIVDWHVLTEQDPNVYAEEASDFFSVICAEYQDTPNVIYEICNEPNGETTWTDIRRYSERIIPEIRAISPDSVILVGTPNYDRTLTAAARVPLYYDNLMYVLHFYAGTHKEDLRRELIEALANGMPIFISECGLSESTGDGDADYVSSAEWFSLLKNNDLSYTIWSLSNKDERSALLRPEYDPSAPMTEESLTPVGRWARSVIHGTDPQYIPIPDDENGRKGIGYYITRSLHSGELIPVRHWPRIALGVLLTLLVFQIVTLLYNVYKRKHYCTYDDLYRDSDKEKGLGKDIWDVICATVLVVSMFFTMLYLYWRIVYSVPKDQGVLPVIGNLLLLAVEILGFIESIVLYRNLMSMRNHPLPVISPEEYPEVDIFIATYNEPADLLKRTINGCNHLKYPDKSKVHVWLCDDNRRAEMKELAADMGIGYFDRPDNKGAKAGNLNNALRHTSAPYIVTLDADMIPRSNFLMNTIPYFVDAAKRADEADEKKNGKASHLGLLQTPQCFYDPDVFQHALYSENNAPNEQDFFYRTIEVAKTSTNSVIYGGSNTVIAREALEKIGGFYTESITEDFATGLLIESAGYVSLGIPEPMASGITPHTYKEHIQQRKRWGRGVISTARQLKLLRRKGLSVEQKFSYWSSVIYWYSPLKNLIYMLSPMLYAVFAIPVFKCSWLDLVVYWLPMFILQDVCLRLFSKNAVSLKWSGIYETSVMPHLLIPIIKETFGITASVFEVTDKSGSKSRRKTDLRTLMPFIVLIILSVIGIIRSVYVFTVIHAFGIAVLLFWLIRNLYYLIMSVFLVDGRDSDGEQVKVIDAEQAVLKRLGADDSDPELYGVTTYMTEHSLRVYSDETGGLSIGDGVDIKIENDDYIADMKGFVTGIRIPKSGGSCVYSVEITDKRESEPEYLQILYDRIPTLPQSLQRDHGIISHMLINAAHRVLILTP